MGLHYPTHTTLEIVIPTQYRDKCEQWLEKHKIDEVRRLPVPDDEVSEIFNGYYIRTHDTYPPHYALTGYDRYIFTDKKIFLKFVKKWR